MGSLNPSFWNILSLSKDHPTLFQACVFSCSPRFLPGGLSFRCEADSVLRNTKNYCVGWSNLLNLIEISYTPAHSMRSVQLYNQLVWGPRFILIPDVIQLRLWWSPRFKSWAVMLAEAIPTISCEQWHPYRRRVPLLFNRTKSTCENRFFYSASKKYCFLSNLST
jgi:hypothetical protein